MRGSTVVRFAAAALLPMALPLTAHAAPDMESADVLARTVQRGEVLSESDFVAQDIPAGRARRALAMADAAGLEARRTLHAGKPVRASDLMKPRLVRRGDPVTISVREGALNITASGRSLGDAALGQTVRVFSEATNHTLDALVEGSGAVRVAAQ